MSKSKYRLSLTVGILLALFFGIALYLRVYLPYDQVFSGEWIKFTGIDAYYHMHLVDNLAHHFPHFTDFDPYLLFPGGSGISGVHFFNWLLAGIIWVISLGSPTQHTIDVIGVYFPAILGALVVIPVYFIGKEIFGRWAGLVSAGLIAIMPGEFLGRSILGFTDQHVAETLFTATTMMFLVLAIKASRERGLTFNHLRQRNRAVMLRPIIYSLLTGICLGIYFITWQGALLFAFVISVYFVIQFIIDHLRHQSTDYLCIVGVILFLITLMIYVPVGPGGVYLVSLGIVLFTLVVLSLISRLMASKKIKPAYYPLTLVGLGGLGLAIFYAIEHAIGTDFLVSMFNLLTVLIPKGAQLTTIEMQPLLFPTGKFTTVLAWGNFTTGFYLSLISLGALIYLVVKRGSAEKGLLVVWSLIILAAVLSQRRFAYYFAVNVALLTGYFSVLVYYVIRFIIDYLRDRSTDYMSWQALELAGFEELVTRPVELSTRAGRKRAKLKGGQEVRYTISYASIILWMIVVFFLVFFPCIGPATATARQARFAPTDAWISSLSWMKENTPEPFDNPDFYYHLEEGHKYLSLSHLMRTFPNPSGDPDFYYQLEESYKYPESAYGVMAWWDYGYWITRIAHRIPNANPGQDPRAVTSVASFLLSRDEDSGDEIMQELDSSYIIIDYHMTTGKFWAIATWLGKEPTEFFDIYHKIEGDKGIPVLYFYPEYYRSLVVRLYNFDGKAATPENPVVISYQEKVSREGITFKQIMSEEEFDSYEEAEAYLLSQESDNYRLVGTDPLISPVPLEALKHYKLIHSSEQSRELSGAGAVPEVKVFEYIGDR